MLMLFVFQHYGLEIIAKELQIDQTHPDVHRLFLAVYKNFIEVVLLALSRLLLKLLFCLLTIEYAKRRTN